MDGEARDERDLRALEIACMSGFMESLRSTQVVCLSLCNGCREGVPVQRLRMNRRGPPALLAMLCPDVYHPECGTPSRVVPLSMVRRIEFRHRWWSPSANGFIQEFLKANAGLWMEDDDSFECHKESIVDIAVENVQWPSGTKEIYLPFVNDGVHRATWPAGLEVLAFSLPPQHHMEKPFWPAESLFNSPLNGLRFPSRLREIFMGVAFDQSITAVAWPKGLERLSLPGFNQSIQGVRWPAGLKSLEFLPPSEIRLRQDRSTSIGMLTFQFRGFNQSLGSALPASLETLWLSDSFKQRLENVIWPRGLVSLGMGFHFRSSFLAEVSWPRGLRKLFTVDHIGNRDAVPVGCEIITVMNDEDDWGWFSFGVDDHDSVRYNLDEYERDDYDMYDYY